MPDFRNLARSPGWTQHAPGLYTREPFPREMTADDLRELDRTASQDLGIPIGVLMENAAIHTASIVAERPSVLSNKPVLIIAGPGNNGGDGLALARQLLTTGIETEVILVGDPQRLAPDTAWNATALQNDLEILFIDPKETESFSKTNFTPALDANAHGIVVDALFGTGLSRPISGIAAEVVEWVNQTRRLPNHPEIISLDVPSGMDADSGHPLGPCVRADLTVTFAALKAGFKEQHASLLIGDLALVPIGVPPKLLRRFGVPLARTHRPG